MEFNGFKIIKGFIYGLLFGFFSPVPGISAGTMAVLFNVYESFFSSVSVAALKKNFISVISFLIGWGAGLLAVSNIMIFLFDNHGQVIAFCFIGLILGCVPVIYKNAAKDKIRFKNVLVLIFALAFMIFLAFYGGDLSTNSSIEQRGGLTPLLVIWIFTASLISSMAMLMPGIGGSLMMLVLGIYTIYIEAVATLDPVVLSVFIISMIIGVLAGIALTKKMLEKYSQTLYCAILGFIIGSLFIIYPGFSFDITGLISIVLACICAVLAYWLSKKG